MLAALASMEPAEADELAGACEESEGAGAGPTEGARLQRALGLVTDEDGWCSPPARTEAADCAPTAEEMEGAPCSM